MKIIILLKETPDTEAKILPHQDQKTLDLNASSVKWIVNPYDENAVEEALKQKDKDPATEVVILSLGPQGAKERMIKALAMGADRGILIDSEAYEWDSLSIARALAKVIEQEKPHVVLAGKQAIDDDNMHVPLMVAQLLNWPHMNCVFRLSWDSQTHVTVERELEGGQTGVYGMELPAVVGCHQALGTPRYASLPGIMKAKKKPLDVKTSKDLGLSAQDLSPKVRSTGYSLPKAKGQGKILSGDDPKLLVDQLVNLLKDEAKVL